MLRARSRSSVIPTRISPSCASCLPRIPYRLSRRKYRPARDESPEAKEKGTRVAALEQDLGRLQAAAQQLAELQRRETDATVSDAKLVAAYKEYRSKYGGGLDSANTKKVTERIKEFEISAAAFDELRRRDDLDSLTVREQLDLWGKYHPARGASPEATFKADRVAALKQELGEQ